MKVKELIEYSLLRMNLDERPIWAVRMGIHSVGVNEEIFFNPYFRLNHKKKFGSFTVNPKAPEDIQRKFDSLYTQRLERLRELNDQ